MEPEEQENTEKPAWLATIPSLAKGFEMEIPLKVIEA
jgi:hypothetical protein